MTIWPAGTIALMLTALSACGGGDTSATAGSNGGVGTATTGGEDAEAEVLLPPPTPGRSQSLVLDPAYRYIIRSDISQVRETPLEPEISRLLQAIPQWRAVLDVTDLDPINDIDCAIAAAPGRGSKEYIMLARHTSTLEEVKAFVVAIAASRGEELVWGVQDGIPVADWPGEPEVVQSVALPRPDWVVIGPSAEVARLILVSQNDESELLPGFPMPWDGGGAVVDEGVGLMGTGRGVMGGETEDRPHYPSGFNVKIYLDDSGDVTAEWQGSFDTDAEAAAAVSFWDERRDEYSGNPMLSLLGLSSAIEGARFVQSGADLRLSLSLSLLQMSRLIRFATPVLVGGRRGARQPTEGTEPSPATR